MSAVEAIGVLSGTSVDAVDVAWVGFKDNQKPVLRATHAHPIPKTLRDELLRLMQPSSGELVLAGKLDRTLGMLFAEAILAFFAQEKITAKDITVIGSHGQTVRHHPEDNPAFTYQLADPNTIVANVGCPVVADFRRRDVAEGGQGAPLAPAFHQAFLSREAEAVVNIGGIANTSILPLGLGFDTGPGNALLDAWAYRHTGSIMDVNGCFAAKGQLQPDLLAKWLADPFFKKPPPKSTGREVFHLDWLSCHLSGDERAEDIQATLVHLTAKSIVDALSGFPEVESVLICGGGAHNPVLVRALQEYGQKVNLKVQISDRSGWPADWLEGMLFAWLAKLRWCNERWDWSSITGGGHAMLGGLYLP